MGVPERPGSDISYGVCDGVINKNAAVMAADDSFIRMRAHYLNDCHSTPYPPTDCIAGVEHLNLPLITTNGDGWCTTGSKIAGTGRRCSVDKVNVTFVFYSRSCSMGGGEVSEGMLGIFSPIPRSSFSFFSSLRRTLILIKIFTTAIRISAISR